jgi:hypothetical protein
MFGVCVDCTDADPTGAGGAYRGSLIGQRGICAEFAGMDPGGRKSSE